MPIGISLTMKWAKISRVEADTDNEDKLHQNDGSNHPECRV